MMFYDVRGFALGLSNGLHIGFLILPHSAPPRTPIDIRSWLNISNAQQLLLLLRASLPKKETKRKIHLNNFKFGQILNKLYIVYPSC